MPNPLNVESKIYPCFLPLVNTACTTLIPLQYTDSSKMQSTALLQFSRTFTEQ